ncbi:hypothetical protein [Candidatus Marithrix sp. Canyon 246]|uniref:hypothetical protein n=1 Tax=Candidatus Marithrix sp. Canyon 246 TaxID=1827136 RepID=UPI00084A0E36|nr:hypothetical protein [Candidatus Marithrix sp. Canyon 246]
MKLQIILGLIFTLTSNITYGFDLFNPDRGKAKSESRRYSKPTISKPTTNVRPSSSKRTTKSRPKYIPHKKLEDLIKKLRSSKKLANPFKQVFPIESKILPTALKKSELKKLAKGTTGSASYNYIKKARKAVKKRVKKRRLKRQRDFVLQGTSRIGSRRAVVLKAPNNKQFVLYFEDNVVTEIKGYEGYYLLQVEPREIVIEYPEDAPCRKSNPKKGVICNQQDEGRTALLSLERDKIVAASTSQPQTAAATTETEKPKKSKFKRKVIKEEDVPPGMRVVHTPFGDRLIPVK